MLGITSEIRVFLKTGTTDGRLGYEGLRGLVSKAIREDARGGHLFVFCNVGDAFFSDERQARRDLARGRQE